MSLQEKMQKYEIQYERERRNTAVIPLQDITISEPPEPLPHLVDPDNINNNIIKNVNLEAQNRKEEFNKKELYQRQLSLLQTAFVNNNFKINNADEKINKELAKNFDQTNSSIEEQQKRWLIAASLNIENQPKNILKIYEAINDETTFKEWFGDKKVNQVYDELKAEFTPWTTGNNIDRLKNIVAKIGKTGSNIGITLLGLANSYQKWHNETIENIVLKFSNDEKIKDAINNQEEITNKINVQELAKYYSDFYDPIIEETDRKLLKPDYFSDRSNKTEWLSNFAEAIILETPQQIFQTAMLIANPTLGMAYMGFASGNDKYYNLLINNPELPENTRFGNAIITGIINGALERISSGLLGGNLTKKGAESAIKVTIKQAKELTKRGALYTVAKGMLTEYGQEGFEQLAENALDLVTEVHGKFSEVQNKMEILFQGVGESALMGGVFGAPMSYYGYKSSQHFLQKRNIIQGKLQSVKTEILSKENPTDDEIKILDAVETVSDAFDMNLTQLATDAVVANEAIKKTVNLENYGNEDYIQHQADESQKELQQLTALKHNSEATKNIVLEIAKQYPKFKFTIITDYSQIDTTTQKIIQNQNYELENINAFIKGNQIFINANEVAPSQVSKIIGHEIIGHIGIKAFLGEKNYNTLLTQLAQANPEKIQELSQTYKTSDQLYLAEEYLANLSDSNIKDANILQVVYQKIKSALRTVPLLKNVRYTDSEINRIIRLTQRNLHKEKINPNQVESKTEILEKNLKYSTKQKQDNLISAEKFIVENLNKNTRNKTFKIILPIEVEQKVENIIGEKSLDHTITINSVIHSIKNHGENGIKNNKKSIPITNEIASLIPNIMVSPDKIILGSVDRNGNKSIRFTKEISNGQIIVVEKQKINNPQGMETITMWAELSNVTDAHLKKKSPSSHVQNVIISKSDIINIKKDAQNATENSEDLQNNAKYDKNVLEKITPKLHVKTSNQTKEILLQIKGKELHNNHDNTNAKITRPGIEKMVSNAAMYKSRNNGFTNEEHLTIAANLEQLFPDAFLSKVESDRIEDVNINAIKRYSSLVFINDKFVEALWTVKDTTQHGNNIYSVELMDLELKEKTARDDALKHNEKTEENQLNPLTDGADNINNLYEQAIDALKNKYKFSLKENNTKGNLLAKILGGYLINKDVKTDKTSIDNVRKFLREKTVIPDAQFTDTMITKALKLASENNQQIFYERKHQKNDKEKLKNQAWQFMDENLNNSSHKKYIKDILNITDQTNKNVAKFYDDLMNKMQDQKIIDNKNNNIKEIKNLIKSVQIKRKYKNIATSTIPGAIQEVEKIKKYLSNNTTANLAIIAHNLDAIATLEEADNETNQIKIQQLTLENQLIQIYNNLKEQTPEKINEALKYLQDLTAGAKNEINKKMLKKLVDTINLQDAVIAEISPQGKIFDFTNENKNKYSDYFLNNHSLRPLLSILSTLENEKWDDGAIGKIYQEIEKSTQQQETAVRTLDQVFLEKIDQLFNCKNQVQRGKITNKLREKVKNTGIIKTEFQHTNKDGTTIIGRRIAKKTPIEISEARLAINSYESTGKLPKITIGKKFINGEIQPQTVAVDIYGIEFLRMQLADHDAGLEQIYEIFGDAQDNAQINHLKQEIEPKDQVILIASASAETELAVPTELEISQDTALELWLMWQQDHYKPTMTWNGYTKKTIEQIEKFISPELLQLGKFMREYIKNNSSKLNTQVIEKYGAPLPEIPNYFPGAFSAKNKTAQTKGIGMMAGSLSINPAFLISRKFHLLPPNLEAQATMTFLANQLESEHFIAWNKTINTLRNIFNSRNVKQIINQNFGENFTKSLIEKIQILASGGKQAEKISKILNDMFKIWTPAKISWNITSTIKQIFSAIGYMNEVPVRDFIKYTSQALLNNSEYRIFINSVIDSDYMKNRYAGGLNKELIYLLKHSQSGSSTSYSSMILEAGLIPMQKADKLAVLKGGYAVYAYYKRLGTEQKNMTQQQAHDYAIMKWQRASDQTQQSGYLKDQNAYQSNQGWFRWATGFLSTPILTMQLQIEEFQKQILKQKNQRNFKKLGRQILINHIINPTIMVMVTQIMKNGFDIDEFEIEDFITGWLLGPFEGLFLLGKAIPAILQTIITAKRNQYSPYSAVPLLDDITKGSSVIGKILKGKPINENDLLDSIKLAGDTMMTTSFINPNLATTGGAISAITSQTKRIKKITEK